MTLTEIITTCNAIAEKYGVQLVNCSNEYTLNIEYHKNGNYIGGAGFIGVAEHPEYFTASDLKGIEAQIKYLSRKRA